MVDSHQVIFANRSDVRYDFTNMKKIGEKVGENRGKFYLTPIVCQRVADCFCAVHTKQLESANFSVPCQGRLRRYYYEVTEHTILLPDSFDILL